MKSPVLLLALGLALVPGIAGAADAGASAADAGAAVTAAAPSAIPASPADVARRARVAVKVGETAVTVGELEDRLANLPPFQLETYGASPAAAIARYVDDVVVRDLLLGEAARRRGLAKEPLTHERLLRARSNATLRALRAGLGSPATIPAADVAAYFEANRGRFEAAERVNVWRILCATEAEAREVLTAAKAEPTITKFQDLARDHSQDKATKYRGGNLGFLADDGTSNEVGLKVDPALVKAVHGLADGELAPAPVPEAGAFAVLWRRATVAPTHRTLAEVDGQIRATLYRERAEAAERKLVEDLRARRLRDYDAEPLKIIEFPALDAGINLLPRSVPSGRR